MSGPGPHNLDKVPNQEGYLILNDSGAVMASSGDLENDEATAATIIKMIRLASKVNITSDNSQSFKRLSVIFDDFLYIATISSDKVYISKRKNIPKEPVLA
ncbi:ragulator complex protein LAMTOR4 homolog [Lytechinus variegatus]|uniref:ragulator complex protein LAMTOR4 homolog n=1 Tax=Lytechinus variegatus TaxID=7654 RepID=UPI001BB27307|nr:ragulator complex protein LAMTOR4 homolog [Lytechinus variegatus]